MESKREIEREKMTKWGLRILAGGAAFVFLLGMILGYYLAEQSLKQQILENSLLGIQYAIKNCGR